MIFHLASTTIPVVFASSSIRFFRKGKQQKWLSATIILSLKILQYVLFETCRCFHVLCEYVRIFLAQCCPSGQKVFTSSIVNSPSRRSHKRKLPRLSVLSNGFSQHVKIELFQTCARYRAVVFQKSE